MTTDTCTDCGTRPSSQWSLTGYCRRCDEKAGYKNHIAEVDVDKLSELLGFEGAQEFLRKLAPE